MAYYDLAWYCNAGDQATTGYYAVAKWAATTAIVAGSLRRQLAAPAVGNERVFVAIVAGTTGGSEPAWVLTRGAKTTDGTVTWQECTGASAVNGDLTDTVNWTAAKAIGTPSLGAIIKRNSGASYQICTTAGTLGAAEPAFSDTAGVTTTETAGTTVWTSLGPVGSFTGGQAPHARLANVCAASWFAAGNTVYVGDNHAESQATAVTMQPALTQATVGRIVCHNHAGNYPPASADLRTTATVSTTVAANINFTANGGSIYVYGLSFVAGVGQSGTAAISLVPGNALYFFDACIFRLATTGTFNTQIILNTLNAGVVFWNNCQVSFAAAGQYINVATTNFTWQNTGLVLAAGSVTPTNLMAQTATGYLCNIILEALDLSQITSVFGFLVASIGNWVIKDCKLNASAVIANPANTGQIIQSIRADSGATAYKSARYAYEGTETTETSITRVGGAVDPSGQAQSRKLVTTANAQWLRPFKAEPYAIWNPQTAANVTVTVCGTINAGALPNNDDIWLEVEYLGSATFPIGTIVATTKANLLTSNAAVASDASVWNNTGAAPTTFNPSDLSSVTLSNANLTATNNNNSAGVRSIGSISSGKYYWEYTITNVNTNNFGVGIAPAAYVLSSALTANTAQVKRAFGIATINGTNFDTIGSFVNGSVFGVAVDMTAKLIWFRLAPSGAWNGGGTANPATGIGGYDISAMSGAMYGLMIGGISDACNANFGASAFSGAVPSGFTSGLLAASIWSPFKLTTTLSSPQPGMAGYIHARVRAAKPSTTWYIDPKIVLDVGAAWLTTYSQSPISDNSGWTGYNIRQVVSSANLAFNGSQVRVTMAASAASGGFVIDFAEIGHAAASGDPYDFDGGQVPLTFSGGSAGCTVAQGAAILSDAITFSLDKTKNFIVAMHFVSGAFRQTTATSYYHFGASEVSVANVSIYSGPNAYGLVSLIEVLP